MRSISSSATASRRARSSPARRVSRSTPRASRTRAGAHPGRAWVAPRTLPMRRFFWPVTAPHSSPARISWSTGDGWRREALPLVGRYRIDLALIGRLVELIERHHVERRLVGAECEVRDAGRGQLERAQELAARVHDEEGAGQRRMDVAGILPDIDLPLGIDLDAVGIDVHDMVRQL